MKLCNANFANPFLATLLRQGVALLSRIQALLTTLSLLYPIILCKFKKKLVYYCLFTILICQHRSINLQIGVLSETQFWKD